jgi:hypothetical protein
MVGSHSNSPFVSGRHRMATTLIACSWGLASAYLLFYSLLIESSTRNFLLGLVPLVAVWASLERKRWGRLALLGLSSATLGVFAADFGLVISKNFTDIMSSKAKVSKMLADGMEFFDFQPQILLALLVLAAMTAYWMCRPVVRDEYETGKKATLAIAQKAIAITVVGCWGMVFLMPTGMPTPPKNSKQPASSQKPDKNSKNKNQVKRAKHASNRANRSAELRNSA